MALRHFDEDAVPTFPSFPHINVECLFDNVENFFRPIPPVESGLRFSTPPVVEFFLLPQGKRGFFHIFSLYGLLLRTITYPLPGRRERLEVPYEIFL